MGWHWKSIHGPEPGMDGIGLDGLDGMEGQDGLTLEAHPLRGWS